MFYPIDRAKARETLLVTAQKARFVRADLICVLDSVNAYTGKQINKRICTKIEEDAPRHHYTVSVWDGETKSYEDVAKIAPTYHARLDKRDFGSEYTLTLYPFKNDYYERETFYFDTLDELKERLSKRIEGLNEQVSDLMALETALDSILDRYEIHAKEIDAINGIKGIYALRDFVKWF